MTQEVINKMAEIVQNTMTMFQSDFEQDKKTLDGYFGKFIWQIAPTHTHLHICGNDYLNKLVEEERVRYAWCQGDTWADACIDIAQEDEKFYCYDDETDEFYETTKEDAKTKWGISKRAALNRWSLYSCMALPTDFKVRIEFASLETRRYFIEQLRYASQHNDNSLIDCVRRFRNYRKAGAQHKIVISRDFADRSFQFYEDYGNSKYGLNGGIIFHGYPSEGYRENFSVQLTPSYGWSIHT